MFEKIEMMRMARAMGQHAAQRHVVVARNIANADTPGYRAQDLGYHRATTGALRVTNARHLDRPDWSPASRIVTPDGETSPNGNSVSLEEEMLKAAELKRQHDLSLGIYRSALDLMRSSLGRR